MMEHGGEFHTYFSRSLTTHVVVSSMAESKKSMFDKLRVVSAEWIVQSLAANTLLDWRRFQFKSKVVGGQKSADAFFQKVAKKEEEGEETGDDKIDVVEKTDGNVGESSEQLLQSLMIKAENQTDNDGEIQDFQINMCDNMNADDVEEPMDEDPVKESEIEIGDRSLSDVSTDFQRPPSAASSAASDPSPRTSPSSASSTTTIGRPQDPQFLAEFFKNSRLHHISQLGAEWKEYVRRLQDEAPTSFPGRDQLKQQNNAFDVSLLSGQRVIMHIDMDCFFVSVGLRSRPELRGRPVAVTHSRGTGTVRARPGADLAWEMKEWRARKEKPLKDEEKRRVASGENGTDTVEVGPVPLDVRVRDDPSLAEMSTSEIASCSYEARACGVKNGTFLGAAKKLCPNLVTIPYDFDGYREVSKILYDTIASYTTHMEAVSCDECFVDLTEVIKESRTDPSSVASFIRAEIKSRTGCPASAGLGPNRLLARLATRRGKPDGQFRVHPGEAADFIAEQPVGDLPGVGRAMKSKLTKLGVATCADLRDSLTLASLKREFGSKIGEFLYESCRGEDRRPIQGCKLRKSISVDVNYGIRFKGAEEPFRFLDNLAVEVENRMKTLGIRGKFVSLKLLVRSPDAPVESGKFGGHGIVDHLHKSAPLANYTRDACQIGAACRTLLKTMGVGVTGSDGVAASDVRGMGITLTKLDNQPEAAAPAGLRDISRFMRGKDEGKAGYAASKHPKSPSTITSKSNSTFNIEPVVKTESPVKSDPCVRKPLRTISNPNSADAATSSTCNLPAAFTSVDPAKLKSLVKDWLRLHDVLESPTVDEVDFLIAVLLTRVYDDDLTTPFTLCKTFLRKSRAGELKGRWGEAVEAIVAVIQNVVCEELGHPFLLE